MDKDILFDNITTFTMFYSDGCSILLDQVKDKLKNIMTVQSFGPASAWITSNGSDIYDTLEDIMEYVSKFLVFTRIADRHLSIRRLRRFDGTMRQSLQVLTDRDKAIVVDAYSVIQKHHLFYAIEQPEMQGLLRSIVRRSAEKHGFIPPRAYIQDVSLSDNHAVSGGGFADVYKGSLASGSVVAMKVLRFFGTSEHLGWKRCFQSMCSEAMLWKTFDHENIIPLLGLAYIGSGPTQKVAMVSPWMQNGDLGHFLLENPRTDRTRMLCGVIKGIEYLHGLSPPVVHGDLRCANILIDDDGDPLLSDFGLSRIEAVFSATTGSTHGGGSLRWQAPELLYPSKYGGNGRQTTQSDIYAFGMTCVEVFTDAVPFQGIHDAAVITTVLNDGRPDQPPFDASGRGLIARVWELVTECWHPVGSERPSAVVICREFSIHSRSRSRSSSVPMR
ncbi:kinase-like domain-containing protein [Phellopilus nigrolimitatus]|nr:kinase-like domain-containing protein [Phellopilus nigrolimitatus]